MCKRTIRAEQGFTLVEITIAILIIGLLIAGVMVGFNLIRASELRATLQQLESFDAAVNTFRAKYGGFPGDFNKASRMGLPSDGDGDGLLEDADGATADLTGEITGFWVQLSTEGMVSGSFAFYTSGDNDMTVGTHFPRTKYSNNGIVAFNADQDNYYYLGATDSANDTMQFVYDLTPADAQAMDIKADDGIGSSGDVIAVDGATPADNTGDCLDNFGGTDDYVLDTNDLVCQLRLRFH